MSIKLTFPTEIDPCIIDTVTTAGITYMCINPPNSNAQELTKVAIMIIDETTPGMQLIKWSNGVKTPNVAWANRASLTYKYLEEEF